MNQHSPLSSGVKLALCGESRGWCCFVWRVKGGTRALALIFYTRIGSGIFLELDSCHIYLFFPFLNRALGKPKLYFHKPTS